LATAVTVVVTAGTSCTTSVFWTGRGSMRSAPSL
jgi:hypothetical protein